MFHQEGDALVREFAGEKLVIQPWGKDSLRVRSTMRPVLEEEDWALLPVEASKTAKISIQTDGSATISNGRITARIDPRGQISFLNQKNDVLLQEFIRVRLGDMQKSTGQGMDIEWKDGHKSHYAFSWLRDACPCATCNEEREASGRKIGEPPKLKPGALPMYKEPARPLEIAQVRRRLRIQRRQLVHAHGQRREQHQEHHGHHGHGATPGRSPASRREPRARAVVVREVCPGTTI